MKQRLFAITICLLPVLFCRAQSVRIDGKIAVKIDQLIKQMTLAEKVGMIHGNSSFTSAGIPRLGIPEFVMSDGPHGVRLEHGRTYEKQNDVKDAGTYLPTGVCLAATWNPKLGYDFGSVLGS